MVFMHERWLRELREGLNLTAEQVAQECGVDQSVVSRWERLEVEPKPRYRTAYARTLGTTLEEMAVHFWSHLTRTADSERNAETLTDVAPAAAGTDGAASEAATRPEPHPIHGD